MKAKFYSIEGIGPAKAALVYSPHTERCRICQNDITKGTLAVVGSSFHPMLGYIGGYFHQVCWIHKNFTVLNGKVIKMATEKVQAGQIPLMKSDLSDIGELLAWDYKHSDIVDKEVVILSVKETKTGYGPAFLGKCIVDDKECRILFGGEVLVQQLDNVKNMLPLRATVKKEGKYFTF